MVISNESLPSPFIIIYDTRRYYIVDNGYWKHLCFMLVITGIIKCHLWEWICWDSIKKAYLRCVSKFIPQAKMVGTWVPVRVGNVTHGSWAAANREIRLDDGEPVNNGTVHAFTRQTAAIAPKLRMPSGCFFFGISPITWFDIYSSLLSKWNYLVHLRCNKSWT